MRAIYLIVLIKLLIIIESKLAESECDYELCLKRYNIVPSLITQDEQIDGDAVNLNANARFGNGDDHPEDDLAAEFDANNRKWRPRRSSKPSRSRKNKSKCTLLRKSSQCLKEMSADCRGNLNYHTALIWHKNALEKICPRRPKVKAADSEHFDRFEFESATVKPVESSPSHRSLIDDFCSNAAFNFSTNNELNYFKYLTVPTHSDHENLKYRPANRDPVAAARTSDSDERKISNAKSINAMSVFTDEDDVHDDNDDKRTFSCAIYGDLHIRTFARIYQTCNCVGTWPLIDHPLFTVQRTSSQYGKTLLTILIKSFTPCDLHKTLIYEVDYGGHGALKLPSTFTDNSNPAGDNRIRIEKTNDSLVIVHLEHIGIRIYLVVYSITKENEQTSSLNIVIDLTVNESKFTGENLINSLSSYSLCRNGCPLRDYTNISSIVEKLNALPTEKKEADLLLSLKLCNHLSGYYRITCIYESLFKRQRYPNDFYKFLLNFDTRPFTSANHYRPNHPMSRDESSSSLSSSSFLFFIICFVKCSLLIW